MPLTDSAIFGASIRGEVPGCKPVRPTPGIQNVNSSGDGDVDLSHGLDCLPHANETGLHDETVPCRIAQRFAAIRSDLDDTFKNVAELEGFTLDRAALAWSRFPYAGVHGAVAGLVQRPGLEGRIAGDQALWQGFRSLWFEGGSGIERLEE
ncbi:Hypothetical protein AT6N2_L1676 [Agrobacterium tumefaciens]|nr:Hypothetical protein AT6N2_L1676 [Agrobacterium tumefaciens]